MQYAPAILTQEPGGVFPRQSPPNSASPVPLSDGCNEMLLISGCILNGTWINSCLCFPHMCTCLDLEERIRTHPRYFCQRCHIISNYQWMSWYLNPTVGSPLLLFRGYLQVLVKPAEGNFSSLICYCQLFICEYVQHRQPHWRRALCLENNSSRYKHRNMQRSVHVSTQRWSPFRTILQRVLEWFGNQNSASGAFWLC